MTLGSILSEGRVTAPIYHKKGRTDEQLWSPKVEGTKSLRTKKTLFAPPPRLLATLLPSAHTMAGGGAKKLARGVGETLGVLNE